MQHYKNKHYQQGVGLLEVLIAAAVFMVGLLAVISLQTHVLRSNSDARDRTVATHLAQDKLEDWRGILDTATDYAAIGNTAAPEIRTVDGKDYNITVDVTGYNIMPAGAEATTSGEPDFKEIIVTVQWEDNVGERQQVQLNSKINKSSAIDSGNAASGEPAAERPTPHVPVAPGNAPDVISLSLGSSGLTKEATKPQLQVIRQSNTVLTRFDDIVYDTNTLFAKQRNAYLTVNCTCRQLGPASGAGQNVGLSPASYDHKTGLFVAGTPVSGKAVGASAGGHHQPEICAVCCRDHHDRTDDPSDPNADPLYDPFRPASDFTHAGDHHHYFADEDGALELRNDVGDVYSESCRLVRIDGIWRVAQDWQLAQTQQVVLDNPSQQADYRNYIKQFLKQYVLNLDLDASDGDARYPRKSPDPSTFSDSSYLSALERLPTIGEPNQRVSRAIYVDYLDDELIQLLQCKINGLSSLGCIDEDTGEAIAQDTDPFGFLQHMPFHEIHEINVTRRR
jgi:type IV pilus modification protein PilV